MPQPHRNTGEMLIGGYRYGFQSQEQDDEIKGAGNSVNYKYRMHDPRIGRFFAVDPLAPKYPHNSPYAFSENRLIDGVELEGLEYNPLGNDPFRAIEEGFADFFAGCANLVTFETNVTTTVTVNQTISGNGATISNTIVKCYSTTTSYSLAPYFETEGSSDVLTETTTTKSTTTSTQSVSYNTGVATVSGSTSTDDTGKTTTTVGVARNFGPVSAGATVTSSSDGTTTVTGKVTAGTSANNVNGSVSVSENSSGTYQTKVSVGFVTTYTTSSTTTTGVKNSVSVGTAGSASLIFGSKK